MLRLIANIHNTVGNRTRPALIDGDSSWTRQDDHRLHALRIILSVQGLIFLPALVVYFWCQRYRRKKRATDSLRSEIPGTVQSKPRESDMKFKFLAKIFGQDEAIQCQPGCAWHLLIAVFLHLLNGERYISRADKLARRFVASDSFGRHQILQKVEDCHHSKARPLIHAKILSMLENFAAEGDSPESTQAVQSRDATSHPSADSFTPGFNRNSRRKYGSSEEADDECPDDGRRSKRRKRTSDSPTSIRDFACPLHKNIELTGRHGVTDGTSNEVCGYKGRGFDNMTQVTRHVRRAHCNWRELQSCTICGIFFRTNSDFSLHVRNCNRSRRCGVRKGDFLQEQVWYKLYETMFPAPEPLPASPYYSDRCCDYKTVLSRADGAHRHQSPRPQRLISLQMGSSADAFGSVNSSYGGAVATQLNVLMEIARSGNLSSQQQRHALRILSQLISNLSQPDSRQNNSLSWSMATAQSRRENGTLSPPRYAEVETNRVAGLAESSSVFPYRNDLAGHTSSLPSAAGVTMSPRGIEATAGLDTRGLSTQPGTRHIGTREVFAATDSQPSLQPAAVTNEASIHRLPYLGSLDQEADAEDSREIWSTHTSLLFNTASTNSSSLNHSVAPDIISALPTGSPHPDHVLAHFDLNEPFDISGFSNDVDHMV